MDVLKSIWDSMLDAELNERYLEHFSRYYYKRDKFIKIFLAIMASGTVASWGIWIDLKVLWKILSTAAAVVAIVSPILKLESIIGRISSIRVKWREVRNEYELIYLSRIAKNEMELLKDYRKIKKIEVGIEDDNLPIKKKLILKIQDEIIESKGL